MNRIIKIILSDIIRNKIVLAYTLILSILSWSSFALEDNSSKGLLTILNVILFTVPLVSILFATIYLYNSAEFIELLLSQPIKRRKIWLSLFQFIRKIFFQDGTFRLIINFIRLFFSIQSTDLKSTREERLQQEKSLSVRRSCSFFF